MPGWSYLQTGRNAEAATALRQGAALDPPTPTTFRPGRGEVLAAQGTVTPAAEGAFRKALAADPPTRAPATTWPSPATSPATTRAHERLDRPAEIRPAGRALGAEVRGFVEKVAAERKIDISGACRPWPPRLAEAGPRGPTQEQMAAAQTMSEGDRQQMIQGMVTGLAARLKQNPKDLAGWQQLIRARMVLGQTSEAQAAYRDASRAFAGSPGEQQALRQAAQQLGVPGA